jgi:branched-chain amino acid transport system substrate-binding protein
VRRKRLFASLLGLSLLAAACGGDDSAGEEAKVDSSVKEGVQSQLGGSSTSAGGATATTVAAKNIAELEAQWDTTRAAVVAEIKQNKWGLDAAGTTINGPDGFKIDVSKCPQGWSNTEGLTDTSIKVGHTTALSGTLADYGNIAKAMGVYNDYVNANGGIKDVTGKTRKLELLVKDDGYDSARTIPLVDELLDNEKVFAMWTLGSPNTMKTYDKLNQRCVPQPFSMTGHPAWGDPVNHPWTTGLQLAYNTESVLWGAFVEQREAEFPETIKIGALVGNNDGGRAWDSALRAYINQSPILRDRVEYFTEVVEMTAPTVKDPMTTLSSKDPDVLILMVAGTLCPQAITEVAESGLKEEASYLFNVSVCKASSFVGRDKVGDASDGWWIVGGGVRDINDPAQAEVPFVKFAREQLQAKGIDPKSSGSLGSGFVFGWPMVEALKIASQLDGGLTRANFIVTLRALELSHPMLLDGVKFNMSGNTDAYFVEGSEFARYDAAKQGWVAQGEVIELSGKSAPCVFDQAQQVCR